MTKKLKVDERVKILEKAVVEQAEIIQKLIGEINKIGSIKDDVIHLWANQKIILNMVDSEKYPLEDWLKKIAKETYPDDNREKEGTASDAN